MNLVVNKTEPDITTKNSEDNVIKNCDVCSQSFIAKYWDEELDWYIELNLTDYCRQCQHHAKS